MALAQYSELFWVPSGAVAANVPARVFLHDTNTLATLYADAGGTTPLANPVSTSGTGRLEFYVEEGRYWVHIDSEAFEVAVGMAAQAATQQDILDEVARADAAYATIVTVTTLSGTVATLNTFVDDALSRIAAVENGTAFLAALNVAGNALVSNGDLTVKDNNKGYRFRRGGSALDLEATGADLILSNWSGTGFNGTQRSYDRYSADALNVQHAGKREFVAALYGGVVHVIDPDGNRLGFHGKTPVTQQAVTGSRADGTALTNLLAALDTLGLIDDQTTA